MEIIVGRKGEQSFPIMDKAVSGKHLKLTTMPDGKVQVEDLGSTNGTFIDGVRIIKKVVDRNTVVQMGSTFAFRISEVISEVERAPVVPPHTPSVGGTSTTLPPKTSVPPKPEYDLEMLSKFEQLESVWNKYQEEKINLQKSNASKGFLRMLPMFVLGGVGYLISCIPELASLRTAITLTGLGLGIIVTWLSYKSATGLPEQMEKLNQQFQIDYVCPKCKHFLGFTPFEGLKNRGQCSACKTKWVKHLLTIALMLWASCSYAQKYFVVSVGICDYKDPQINDLRFTEADVACFNKVVKTHTDEVYTLLGSNATHANVYSYISQVFDKASCDDTVVLFFSGHGYSGGFCCYDMSKTGGGLTYVEIASLFKQCKAKRKMIFADACFSGGLRKEKKENGTTASVRNGDVLFFLSSRTNETSQEMMNGPNGQFTRFLVRGLNGGADTNRDKIVTAKELYDFVHEGVVVATANKQHPVMWGRFNNAMTVINWNTKKQ